mgnify:CR=1 FL=1
MYNEFQHEDRLIAYRLMMMLKVSRNWGTYKDFMTMLEPYTIGADPMIHLTPAPSSYCDEVDKNNFPTVKCPIPRDTGYMFRKLEELVQNDSKTKEDYLNLQRLLGG